MDTIKSETKILAAISYLSWLFFLVSVVVYRSGRQEDPDFYQLHTTRAFTINLIGTIVSVLSFRIDGHSLLPIPGIGLVNVAALVFMIWGIIYAAMGEYKQIPGLDDLIAVFKR